MGNAMTTTTESRPGATNRACMGTLDHLDENPPCTAAAQYNCKDCRAEVCYDCAVAKPAFSSGYPMWDAGCPVCRSSTPEFVPYDRCEAWIFSGPHEPART